MTNGIIDTTTAHGKLVFGMFARLHLIPDRPSYTPELHAYLARLLTDRERLATAILGLADWARADAAPPTKNPTRSADRSAPTRKSSPPGTRTTGRRRRGHHRDPHPASHPGHHLPHRITRPDRPATSGVLPHHRTQGRHRRQPWLKTPRPDGPAN